MKMMTWWLFCDDLRAREQENESERKKESKFRALLISWIAFEPATQNTTEFIIDLPRTVKTTAQSRPIELLINCLFANTL